MALTNDERKWWRDFLTNFEKLGYDINNPADRLCLQIMTFDKDENIFFSTAGDPVQIKNFEDAGNIPLRRTEDIYSSLSEVNEAYVHTLYENAKNNTLWLYDQVGSNRARANSERDISSGEFLREVGVTKSGECAVLQCVYEMGEKEDEYKKTIILKEDAPETDENKPKLTNKEIEKKLLAFDEEFFAKEAEKIVHSSKRDEYDKKAQDKFDSYASKGESWNKPIYSTTVAHAFDSKEMNYGYVRDDSLSDKEHEELVHDLLKDTEDPTDLDHIPVAVGLKNAFSFMEAHEKGFESSLLGKCNGFKTLSSANGRTSNEHLSDIVSFNDGKMWLEQALGGRLMFNEGMYPINLDNPNVVTRMLIEDGIYYFKDNETMPTVLKFDGLTNTLKESVKPIEGPKPVPEPNGITKFFSNIKKFFTGKPFDSVAKFEDYKSNKSVYEVAKAQADNVKFAIDLQADNANSSKKAVPFNEQIKRLALAESIRNFVNHKGLEEDVAKEKRKLLLFTRDTWQDIANMSDAKNPDYSKLAAPDDKGLAAIALTSLLAQEKMNGGIDISFMVETKGVDEMLRVINNSDNIKEQKKKLTPEAIMDIGRTKGHNLTKDLVASKKEAKTEQKSMAKEVQHDKGMQK